MFGPDTFSALALVLPIGSIQNNWPCHSLPLFMAVSMTPNKTYVTLELLLLAAFVADQNWGFMLEPALRSSGSVLRYEVFTLRAAISCGFRGGGVSVCHD